MYIDRDIKEKKRNGNTSFVAQDQTGSCIAIGNYILFIHR